MIWIGAPRSPRSSWKCYLANTCTPTRPSTARAAREAIAWYRERNAEVSERFASEVRQTLQRLEQFPAAGGFIPGVTDPDVRHLPVHNFPYHVVFIRLERHISVLAIAHDRRRPGGYWNENRVKATVLGHHTFPTISTRGRGFV